jgi:GNAT superfamily N-acetyltransferase
VHWLKATYVPTGEIVGAACWMAPGLPVHSMLRRDAYEFYGWREKLNMTQEDVEELWKSVDHVAWDNLADNDDKTREELLGNEPHWYLAPLFTWPEWQGRGVGKLLMQWAIEQADATDPVTPMYLESSAYARAVYMHTGFVPQGARNMVRRGPAVVKGLEAEDEK